MDTAEIAAELYRTLSNLELPSEDQKWNEPVALALRALGSSLGFHTERDAHVAI